MNCTALTTFLVALASALNASPVSSDAAVTCRRAALDLAGAWTNDGFRLRERSWSGTLPAGKPALARVNLLAGNRYWFTAATNAASTTIAVQIYDVRGTPLTVGTHRDGPLAAAAFAPAASGTYLIGVSESGGTPVPFCLVYSYK
ncbi:MAG: hypothetical protein ABIP20_17220 [Chthoniobacteraceae bacterium]